MTNPSFAPFSSVASPTPSVPPQPLRPPGREGGGAPVRLPPAAPGILQAPRWKLHPHFHPYPPQGTVQVQSFWEVMEDMQMRSAAGLHSAGWQGRSGETIELAESKTGQPMGLGWEHAGKIEMAQRNAARAGGGKDAGGKLAPLELDLLSASSPAEVAARMSAALGGPRTGMTPPGALPTLGAKGGPLSGNAPSLGGKSTLTGFSPISTQTGFAPVTDPTAPIPSRTPTASNAGNPGKTTQTGMSAVRPGMASGAGLQSSPGIAAPVVAQTTEISGVVRPAPLAISDVTRGGTERSWSSPRVPSVGISSTPGMSSSPGTAAAAVGGTPRTATETYTSATAVAANDALRLTRWVLWASSGILAVLSGLLFSGVI